MLKPFQYLPPSLNLAYGLNVSKFAAIIHNPTLGQYNAASEPKVNYSLGQDRYLVTGEHVQTLNVLDEQATQLGELASSKFIWPWGKARRLLNEMALQAKVRLKEFLNA